MTDIDRPGIDGELIGLPSEPPHDHIVTDGFGTAYEWSTNTDSWLQIDSHYGSPLTWQELAERERVLTVYAPAKEYRR